MGSGEKAEKDLRVLTLGTPPPWIKPEYVQSTEKFWLHNTSYEYAVLDTAKIKKDQEAKSDKEDKIVLPDIFALRTDTYLAVSDTYPKPYRRLAIVHEVEEFSGELDENSCVKALSFEFEQAKFLLRGPGDISAYLEFRLDFFDKLITFLESQETPPDEEFFARLKRSRDYLQESIKAYSASPDAPPLG